MKTIVEDAGSSVVEPACLAPAVPAPAVPAPATPAPSAGFSLESTFGRAHATPHLPQPRKSNSMVLLAAGVLVGLLLAAVGYFLCQGGTRKPPRPRKASQTATREEDSDDEPEDCGRDPPVIARTEPPPEARRPVATRRVAEDDADDPMFQPL